MINILTHRLDTANPEESLEKDFLIQQHWYTLVKYFLKEGEHIKLKFWCEEDGKPSETFGVESLRNYQVKLNKTEDGRNQMLCRINQNTISIVLQMAPENSEFIIPWDHIEILNKQKEKIFSSEDNGASVLFELTDKTKKHLLNNGLAETDLIKLKKIWL